MKRFFLFPLSLLLASCGASELGSAEPTDTAVVETFEDATCLISDAQIEALRNQFRAFSKKIPKALQSQTEIKRPPIMSPFVEPPTVTMSIIQNPEGLDYKWVVKAKDGCRKDGSIFESVEFQMTLRDNNKTTTDTAHIHLQDKL